MKSIDTIRRDYSLVDLALSFGVELQKSGQEFEGCCPIHSEKTPSFTVFPGRDGVWRFHCFGCGAKGDVVDFVQAVKGVDAREAMRIIAGDTSAPNVAPRQIATARDVYAGIELLPPIAMPAGRLRLYNPKRETWGSFTPSMIFSYPSVGYVVRHELAGGDKETPMVCRVALPSGEECWSRFPFPKPRPLYRVERLKEGQVFVVEGEKCAIAAARLGGLNVVSWAGGTEGVKHADWSPLAGRKVAIWPDADQPGFGTAEAISAVLSGLGCHVRIAEVLRAAA